MSYAISKILPAVLAGERSLLESAIAADLQWAIAHPCATWAQWAAAREEEGLEMHLEGVQAFLLSYPGGGTALQAELDRLSAAQRAASAEKCARMRAEMGRDRATMEACAARLSAERAARLAAMTPRERDNSEWAQAHPAEESLDSWLSRRDGG